MDIPDLAFTGDFQVAILARSKEPGRSLLVARRAMCAESDDSLLSVVDERLVSIRDLAWSDRVCHVVGSPSSFCRWWNGS